MARSGSRSPAFVLALALLPAAAGAPAAGAAPAAKSGSAKPAAPAKAPALLSLSIEPPEVSLAGPRAERQLLVTGSFSDGRERDLTGHVKFFSTAPKAVQVSPDGRVTATADGAAAIRVIAGSLSAQAAVTAAGTAAEQPRSFANEVIPILTRAGCNQGACHGAQHGKGGLKLSLLGYDPDSDYAAVVRQNEGRRVSMTDPAASLLLLKPVLGVPHAGGMRFKKDSFEYRVLLGWLKEGAPAPVPGEPAVTGLEVRPAQRLARPGASEEPETVVIPQPRGPARTLALPVGQRLVALATHAGGRVEDVTRKAQFNSLNDGIARVDSDGQALVAASGETAVMVRYRGAAGVSRITVPYRELASPPDTPRAGFVDTLVAAKWKQMGLTPSPRSSDAEFLRRVYMDVLGTLPRPEEIRAFLASTSGDRRARLIEQVLARPEYVDYWTLKWGDLLRNNSAKVQAKGMWSFYNWLRASFRDNKPMDRFTRELITAQGSAYTTGPANFFRVANNPADLAETTAQVFLGVRLACAKCHHHPFEKWSQDDYWQMAAFFSRVGLKGSQEFGLFGGEQVVRLNPTGEVSNPRTGRVMKPTPLDGEPVDDPVDRRRALAAWLTSPENPLFARSIVNRYWGYLMGRGIVDPIDDMRVTNPPSNPELLDALARDFAGSGFDLKHLLRTILNSETYQLSSTPTPENRLDEVFHTKYLVKRMGAEELLDAVNFATGTSEKFQNLPAGLRAIQLPDPNVPHYFLDTFGRPDRVITCECERSAEPNMAQALHLMNSDFVQNKIAAGDGRVAKLLGANKPDAEIVEELYLVTFSRPPTAEEQTRAQQVVAQAPGKKEGFEDLLWALLNSREFVFKH